MYSLSADKYYIGYTTDITVRLEKHNHQENFNTYQENTDHGYLRGFSGLVRMKKKSSV
ncbi:GIY-YIG nuclease family protein [Agriterribacter humi]|uniref:GIY-YIG nuclease family protein n=1 Tax=Agriterribacter humi TaxID=1104781 RepID=UPI001D004592